MDTPVAAFVPVEPDIDYTELDYEQQIQYTQRIKARVLHKLATSSIDGSVPSDKDGVELLLKVADSMDRTTQNSRRMKVDEQVSGSNADILRAIANLAVSNGNANPLMASGKGTGTTVEVPELNVEELGEFEHNAGIGFIGIVNETVSTFDKRMHPIAEALQKREEEALGIG